MMDRLTVCTLQPLVYWQDPPRTFASLAALLAEAAAHAQLDVVVLPEHFDVALAEDGDESNWLAAQAFASELAQQYRVYLVAGSVERWDTARQARFNTSVVYDRAGQEVGRYDKRRLFGFEKRRSVQPGHAPLVVTVEGVRMGVLICSDLWYPELARRTALDVDLLCVPAQTTIRAESQPAYARLLWRNLAFTRAQENITAVAVSDQAVNSPTPFRCGGTSCIVDPGAEPDLNALQRVLPDGETGYLIAEIDFARLARFRAYRRDNGLLP